jgi:hypothetical protein
MHKTKNNVLAANYVIIILPQKYKNMISRVI